MSWGASPSTCRLKDRSSHTPTRSSASSSIEAAGASAQRRMDSSTAPSVITKRMSASPSLASALRQHADLLGERRGVLRAGCRNGFRDLLADGQGNGAERKHEAESKESGDDPGARNIVRLASEMDPPVAVVVII